MAAGCEWRSLLRLGERWDGRSTESAGQAEQPRNSTPHTIAEPLTAAVLLVRALIVFVSSIVLPSCNWSRAHAGACRIHVGVSHITATRDGEFTLIRRKRVKSLRIGNQPISTEPVILANTIEDVYRNPKEVLVEKKNSELTSQRPAFLNSGKPA